MIDFFKVMEDIRDAMESLDGEEVANVYNLICDNKIKYIEDSIWESIETEQTEED
jgi:DNA-binding protein Fis